MEIKNRERSLVYLSLGSNLGDRFCNLENAVRIIGKRVGNLQSISSIYENPAWQFDAEQDFYNLCLALETDLPPLELLDILQSIEKELGRKEKIIAKSEKKRTYESRAIDIDIIFYGKLIFFNENLIIPHCLFRERRFVLQPLNDIASAFIDIETNNTVSCLLDVCKDQSKLSQIDLKILINPFLIQ